MNKKGFVEGKIGKMILGILALLVIVAIYMIAKGNLSINLEIVERILRFGG